MKKFVLLLSAFLLTLACGDKRVDTKGPESDDKTAKDTVEITYNEDCAKYRDVNVEKCYEVLLPLFDYDSLKARDYCSCVYDKILEEFTCEEIMKIKRMKPEEQEKLFSKIKAGCKQMIDEKYIDSSGATNQ